MDNLVTRNHVEVITMEKVTNMNSPYCKKIKGTVEDRSVKMG